ncbi:hypothetical protein HDU97_005157 [Phlyctochytrium planicorne]|nr:hypothetical protein HDU97_005157 [Phlyctochytrium planicorne]
MHEITASASMDPTSILPSIHALEGAPGPMPAKKPDVVGLPHLSEKLKATPGANLDHAKASHGAKRVFLKTPKIRHKEGRHITAHGDGDGLDEVGMRHSAAEVKLGKLWFSFLEANSATCLHPIHQYPKPIHPKKNPQVVPPGAPMVPRKGLLRHPKEFTTYFRKLSTFNEVELLATSHPASTSDIQTEKENSVVFPSLFRPHQSIVKEEVPPHWGQTPAHPPPTPTSNQRRIGANHHHHHNPTHPTKPNQHPKTPQRHPAPASLYETKPPPEGGHPPLYHPSKLPNSNPTPPEPSITTPKNLTKWVENARLGLKAATIIHPQISTCVPGVVPPEVKGELAKDWFRTDGGAFVVPKIERNEVVKDPRMAVTLSRHVWDGGGSVRHSADGELVYSVEQRYVGMRHTLFLRNAQNRKVMKIEERHGWSGWNYDVHYRHSKAWELLGTLDRNPPHPGTQLKSSKAKEEDDAIGKVQGNIKDDAKAFTRLEVRSFDRCVIMMVADPHLIY